MDIPAPAAGHPGPNRIMDFTPRHLLPIPRPFGLHPPVASIGYVPVKRDWVRTTFQSVNFSFILRGGGEYWHHGRAWPVTAPCVITQYPGVPVEYGFTAPWTDWEELYIIYEGRHAAWFAAAGLDFQARPLWHIHEFAPVLARLGELQLLLGEMTLTSAAAARIDQAGVALVLESLLGEAAPPRDAREQRLRDIQAHVNRHFLDPVDFPALARRHGFSVSTFRRLWRHSAGLPPEQYLLRLRLREACRLLVETRLGVADIARRLHYRDPLYFSRQFRHAVGMPATIYRIHHRMAPPPTALS